MIGYVRCFEGQGSLGELIFCLMVIPNCGHSRAGAMGSLGMEMQTGPWGTAYSGNQHRIRMTILQGWLQRLVFGCVIRVTPAWDGMRLVLGRGPRMLMLYLQQ